MDITVLLQQFADPEVIHTLSLSQKLLGGFAVTLLGMGITFTALVLLQFIVAFMERFSGSGGAVPETEPETVAASLPSAPGKGLEQDEELVAAIAVALAMKLRTSVDNIVIRRIEKVEDHTPAWCRAGIIEQMNNRF